MSRRKGIVQWNTVKLLLVGGGFFFFGVCVCDSSLCETKRRDRLEVVYYLDDSRDKTVRCNYLKYRLIVKPLLSKRR